MRVLLVVCAAILSLGLVQKGPCMADHWDSDHVRYADMCYSDIPYLYTLRGMSEHVWPYSDTHGRYETMEYPPGIAYFAWGASLLTELVGAGPPQSVRASVPVSDLWGLPGMSVEVNQYFVVNAILLAACGFLAVYFLAGAHRGRPWDALGFVASPCLLLTAYVNWDLLAVACVAGTLWAWARDRPLVSGIFVGLGTATKLYPLFLLGALLVVCLRRRRMRFFLLAALGAATAWLAMNLPAMLTGMAQWKVFWHFNAQRGPDLGSLWLWASLHGHTASVHTVNLWSWLLFGAACLGVLALGLLSEHPPRVAQLAFLLVAAFLLVNKVYSPQYVLWLLPLAALARPRWRDLMIWQGCELLYFGAVWLYLGSYTSSSTAGAPDPAYSWAILIRVAGEVYLMALVVRDVLRPSHDPVRGTISPALMGSTAAHPQPTVLAG